MKSNQISGRFQVQVNPEYNNENIVTGLIFSLDGFIIKEAKMIYRVYTLLLELVEEDGPLMSSLDENFNIGDIMSLIVDVDDIKNLTISFMYEIEMVEFCEEWKNKNFKITYWNNSPRVPALGAN